MAGSSRIDEIGSGVDRMAQAADHAYDALAGEGYDRDEVHKQTVCFRAAELMVGRLVEDGISARRETRGGWTVIEHSYAVAPKSDGGEMVGDPTWQQFLPPEKRTGDLPKVLIGDRGEVIAQARSHGVDEATLQLWEANPGTMVPEDSSEADQSAAQAADRAAENGAWERFMNSEH